MVVKEWFCIDLSTSSIFFMDEKRREKVDRRLKAFFDDKLKLKHRLHSLYSLYGNFFQAFSNNFPDIA